MFLAIDCELKAKQDLDELENIEVLKVPLEEVHDHIAEQLTKEKENIAVEKFVDELKSKAEIVES